MVDDKVDTSLANQDEKNKKPSEPKAPSMSYEQVKMMNISLQKQNNIAQQVLLDISETLSEEGTKLLNVSQNIKNLFKAPPPGQQPQVPPNQPAK